MMYVFGGVGFKVEVTIVCTYAPLVDEHRESE